MQISFSKSSINLPYANFGLFHFVNAIFLAKEIALCKFLAILFHYGSFKNYVDKMR